jgi:hypothetical protein
MLKLNPERVMAKGRSRADNSQYLKDFHDLMFRSHTDLAVNSACRVEKRVSWPNQKPKYSIADDGVPITTFSPSRLHRHRAYLSVSEVCHLSSSPMAH